MHCSNLQMFSRHGEPQSTRKKQESKVRWEGQGRGLFHRRIGREATGIARLPIEPLIFFPEICNGHDRWERMGFAFGEREITRN